MEINKASPVARAVTDAMEQLTESVKYAVTDATTSSCDIAPAAIYVNFERLLLAQKALGEIFQQISEYATQVSAGDKATANSTINPPQTEKGLDGLGPRSVGTFRRICDFLEHRNNLKGGFWRTDIEDYPLNFDTVISALRKRGLIKTIVRGEYCLTEKGLREASKYFKSKQ